MGDGVVSIIACGRAIVLAEGGTKETNKSNLNGLPITGLNCQTVAGHMTRVPGLKSLLDILPLDLYIEQVAISNYTEIKDCNKTSYDGTSEYKSRASDNHLMVP